MRGKPLTLQQAMELVRNPAGRWTVVVRDWEGRYAVTTAAADLPREMVFATRDEVRAALQAANGNFFLAGETLRAAWKERRNVRDSP